MDASREETLAGILGDRIAADRAAAMVRPGCRQWGGYPAFSTEGQWSVQPRSGPSPPSLEAGTNSTRSARFVSACEGRNDLTGSCVRAI